MKLERLAYDPGLLVEFYGEALGSLGALCERTWHDRLQIVAEGAAAGLWNSDGALHEQELRFATADAHAARDAAREVFPGSPLTFRLAELLRPVPLPLERAVLAGENQTWPPDPEVAEKLWRAQFPGTNRWRLTTPFKPDFHFSLVVLVRCEIQAIDQHWSLHRLALALPGGEIDEPLAAALSFAEVTTEAAADLHWPASDATAWRRLLQAALERELAADLAGIRARQESYLRRELERIDEYFAHYEQELSARGARVRAEASRVKTAERLAAAKAEHTRRRADQVARHEIRVQPHPDAFVLLAEPAWRAGLNVELAHSSQALEAAFVPRARRWFVPGV